MSTTETSSPFQTTLLEQYDALIRQLPRYERRVSQQRMVQAVGHALDSETPLLVEAGTGSGKSFGYLIPALLSDRRPIVVSTATIALQEQLLQNDLPFLAEALGRSVDAKLVKGRGNYLCIHKLDELQKSLSGTPPLALQTLRAELGNGWDGDYATLDIGVSRDFWDEVRSGPEDCLGWRCRYWEENPYRLARQQLEKADLLITNHALYCQDLLSGGGLLPPHDVLIVDEAHQFARYAQGAATTRIGRYRTTRLLTHIGRRLTPVPDEFVWTLRDTEASLLNWLLQVANGRTAFRLEGDAELAGLVRTHLEVLGDLRQWVEQLPAADLPGVDSDEEAQRAQLQRQQLAEQLVDLHSSWEWFLANQVVFSRHERVNWAEVDPNSLYYELRSTPLMMDQILSQRLWPHVTPILTSATLSVNRQLTYARQELGLPASDTVTLTLPSPFDYAQQCQLYLPAAGTLPDDPNHPGYADAVAEQVVALLNKSEGRAFVLFTSYANMQRVADAVAPQVLFPLRVQGDLPRRRLVEWFQHTPNSVLFGTATFWEGIDVAGDALSCVIIDKLPFTSPEEPVHQATVTALKAAGRDWFNDFALPQATLRLKQGVGRLIRSRQDKGLLAILDPRLRTKGYGRKILNSLPPIPVVSSLSAITILQASPPSTSPK